MARSAALFGAVTPTAAMAMAMAVLALAPAPAHAAPFTVVAHVFARDPAQVHVECPEVAGIRCNAHVRDGTQVVINVFHEKLSAHDDQEEEVRQEDSVEDVGNHVAASREDMGRETTTSEPFSWWPSRVREESYEISDDDEEVTPSPEDATERTGEDERNTSFLRSGSQEREEKPRNTDEYNNDYHMEEKEHKEEKSYESREREEKIDSPEEKYSTDTPDSYPQSYERHHFSREDDDNVEVPPDEDYQDRSKNDYRISNEEENEIDVNSNDGSE